MPSASATRLYVEDSVVRCGEKVGRRKCRKVVLKGGRVVCDNDHEFSIAELLLAAKQAGQVNLEDVLAELFALQMSSPLAQYRGVSGLVVLTDVEIEAALKKPNGENPLNLADGWCQQQMSAVPWSVQQLIKLVELCKTPEWDCQPVLTFEPPTILDSPITFARMYEWLGVALDGLGPGNVRDNVQYSNWPIKENRDWVTAPLSGGWRMYYQPTPFWARKKGWTDQQKWVGKFGLNIRTAPEYTWMMDLWRANGLPENSFWVRTISRVDGWPVNVYFSSYGVTLNYCYHYPEDAFGRVGAAVEGVPLALVS